MPPTSKRFLAAQVHIIASGFGLAPPAPASVVFPRHVDCLHTPLPGRCVPLWGCSMQVAWSVFFLREFPFRTWKRGRLCVSVLSHSCQVCWLFF